MTEREEISMLRTKIARLVKCDRCASLNDALKDRVRNVLRDTALPSEVRDAASEWLDKIK